MPRKSVKLREEDYTRLKRISEKNDVPLTDLLAEAIGKLRGRKSMSETDMEYGTCEECEYDKVQEDASYCPNCGVEFEEED